MAIINQYLIEITALLVLGVVGFLLLGGKGEETSPVGSGSAKPKPQSREDISNFVGNLATWINPLKVLGSGDLQKLLFQLSRAGFRGRQAIIVLVALKLLAVFVGFILGVFMEPFINVVGPQFKYVVWVIMAFSFFKLPDTILASIGNKRVLEINRNLSDLIDLLSICMHAGLTLETGLQKTIQRFEAISPALADEFTVLLSELQLLQNRQMAFDNLSLRVDSPDVKFFSSSIINAEIYGLPLAKTLVTLCEDIRKRRIVAARTYAGKLAVLMLMPMVFFLFPVFVIVTMGPTMVSLSESLSTL